MTKSIKIKQINSKDDLTTLVDEINSANWDEANDEKGYEEEALRKFVAIADNVFLVAYVDGKPAGVVLAMKILKPYKGEDWFYIDEIDVSKDYRRQGVGRALMEKVFEITKRLNLDEVWLGTEPDNEAANQLYKSLKPDEIEEFIGYTYKLKLGEK